MTHFVSAYFDTSIPTDTITEEMGIAVQRAAYIETGPYIAIAVLTSIVLALLTIILYLLKDKYWRKDDIKI